ncbi:hypothetical protein B296_00048520 [Ensete ventricosum]|uniref:LysM domain-containing protein n=1 Tax=Ensete ventricosum TaxID=4639 RepID=A0A426YIW6_ENSVE|nr:hypothetical protein B296_00048520 [Ensete ventricosum]
MTQTPLSSSNFEHAAGTQRRHRNPTSRKNPTAVRGFTWAGGPNPTTAPTQSNVAAFGPRRKRSAAGDQNGSITKCVSEINYAFRERCDRHQFVIESIPPRPCCSNSTRVPARRREGKEEDAEADEMARPTHPLLLLCVIFAVAVAAQLLAPAGAAKFACNARGGAARCQSLLGYTPRNATTLASVMSLFQVRSFRSILAANGLPISTPPSRPVPAGATVRVRFACACSAGHGASMHRPFYKVAPGETLDSIARGVFAGFVTYQEIAAANNISDPALVQAGRELHVPLPCSCDEVEGAAVMHYAHLVAAGSSVKGIAAEFGTEEETLMSLNGIRDPKSVQAGQVLDVPLRGLLR